MSYSAPKIPIIRPIIYILDGIVVFIIAIIIVRRTVYMLKRALVGPIGDPVEKAHIMNVQPTKFSKLAKKPSFQSLQSKTSGSNLK